MSVAPTDEGRHEPEEDPWWGEGWTFDVWAPDGATGACTAIVLLPNRNRAWYWCALARSGVPLLTVVDLDQTVPVGSLRLRRGSLWADHQCEAPFEQWTVTNETYAVALDDPADALGRALGESVPVAFDLEWYAAAEPGPLPEGHDGLAGYQQAGEVEGEIELRGGRLAVVGPASRTHWWGVRHWFDTTWGEPATGLAAPVLLMDERRRRAGLQRVVTPHGWREWLRPLD